MSYRHATVRGDYQDLASGSVLHSAPGFPAFPIFQRALDLHGGDRPAVIWGPCCGSGHLLTVLALLHRRQIASVPASDLDPKALSLAERNLDLLSGAGWRPAPPSSTCAPHASTSRRTPQRHTPRAGSPPNSTSREVSAPCAVAG